MIDTIPSDCSIFLQRKLIFFSWHFIFLISLGEHQRQSVAPAAGAEAASSVSVHGQDSTQRNRWVPGTEYTESQAFWPVVRIGSPHSLIRKGVFLLPPPLGLRGKTHSIAGEGVGWGGVNSDEGTDALVFYVYYNPSTVRYRVALGKSMWESP